jgi:integrase/recombinase XerD
MLHHTCYATLSQATGSKAKQVANKHGVHVTQELRGNISMHEIFRYTQPSPQEKEEIVEQLY